MKSKHFKKTRFLLALGLLTSIFFSSCKKRPAADIELFGKVVDTTATGSAPLMAQIKLYTGAPPGESGSINFGETSTNADGTFTIKSKAGWNSSQYYLLVLTNKGGSSRRYFVPKNGSVDAGVIAF